MGAENSSRRRAIKPIGVAAVAVALTFGLIACGDDDDQTTATEAAAESADAVTVTTADSADGFSWEVSPTPTADTQTVEFTNDSEEFHVLLFVRISEGFTFEEAYELEGEKGSATEVMRGIEAPPGESVSGDVTEPLDPGEYVLFCPLTQGKTPHYELGQLDEFSIG